MFDVCWLNQMPKKKIDEVHSSCQQGCEVLELKKKNPGIFVLSFKLDIEISIWRQIAVSEELWQKR